MSRDILPIVIEILGQNLLEVFVKFLSSLILRKVLLIILNELLNLVLKLFLGHVAMEVGST